jgi:hypothetical protein
MKGIFVMTQKIINSWYGRIAKTGMYMRDFAVQEAGITPTNLSLYLRGKKNPRPLTIEKIESALKRLGV